MYSEDSVHVYSCRVCVQYYGLFSKNLYSNILNTKNYVREVTNRAKGGLAKFVTSLCFNGSVWHHTQTDLSLSCLHLSFWKFFCSQFKFPLKFFLLTVLDVDYDKSCTRCNYILIGQTISNFTHILSNLILYFILFIFSQALTHISKYISQWHPVKDGFSLHVMDILCKNSGQDWHARKNGRFPEVYLCISK